MGGAAQRGEGFEEQLEHAGLTQPPEPFPDAVPGAELGRQRPPGDVVHGEIVHGFEELTVVVALVGPSRPASAEHVQRHRPILVRHPRQHGRPRQKPTRYESPKRGKGNPPPPRHGGIRPHRLAAMPVAVGMLVGMLIIDRLTRSGYPAQILFGSGLERLPVFAGREIIGTVPIHRRYRGAAADGLSAYGINDRSRTGANVGWWAILRGSVAVACRSAHSVAAHAGHEEKCAYRECDPDPVLEDPIHVCLLSTEA